MPLPNVNKLCGAKCRDGHACTNPAMLNGRCKKHNGGAKRGELAPNFKHGRYSEHLPVHLAKRFREAQDDPELLSLNDEIRLLDAFIVDAVSKLESGESGEFIKRLKEHRQAMRKAQDEKDADAAGAALAALLRTIDRGIGEWAAVVGVRQMLQERKSLVESERKRWVEMGQMVTASQVAVLVSVLADIINRNVHDPEQLRNIKTEIDRILLAGPVDKDSKP